MRRRMALVFRSSLAVVASLSLAACDVKFTPAVTPLVLSTAPASPGIGTVAAGGNPSALTGSPPSGTPLATMEPLPTPTLIVSIEEGSVWSPTYERVDCGFIEDDVCFELCYGGACLVYGNDDDRVTRFVEMVDRREQGIRDLEILRAEKGGEVFGAVGECVQAGAGAGLAYAAIVGFTAPEPTISKVLGGVAALGAVVVCGGAIYTTLHTEGVKQELKIGEIIDASSQAAEELESLRNDPPD